MTVIETAVQCIFFLKPWKSHAIEFSHAIVADFLATLLHLIRQEIRTSLFYPQVKREKKNPSRSLINKIEISKCRTILWCFEIWSSFQFILNFLMEWNAVQFMKLQKKSYVYFMLIRLAFTYTKDCMMKWSIGSLVWCWSLMKSWRFVSFPSTLVLSSKISSTLEQRQMKWKEGASKKKTRKITPNISVIIIIMMQALIVLHTQIKWLPFVEKKTTNFSSFVCIN